MRSIIKILGMLLILSGCKTKQAFNAANNQVDVNGNRITVLAYRLFIDGKLKTNGYSYKQNDLRYSGDSALGSLQYGDLNFLFFNTKKIRQTDGMAPRSIHNRSDLRIGNPSTIITNMIVKIDPKLIGSNIYIDSLPLQKGVLEIISIDSSEIIKLSRKFRKLNRWKSSDKLIIDADRAKLRNYFALDTISTKDPIKEVFNKSFFNMRFNEIKNWKQGY